MPTWTAIDPAQVTGRLASFELELYRKKFLTPADDPDADGDPLPEIIGETTDEVRQDIANCGHNVLGADGTLPKACHRHAINIIVFQLLSRIDRLEISKSRTDLYAAATTYFEGVRRCLPRMPKPDDATESSEGGGQAGIEVASEVPRRASRSQLGGL